MGMQEMKKMQRASLHFCVQSLCKGSDCAVLSASISLLISKMGQVIATSSQQRERRTAVAIEIKRFEGVYTELWDHDY